MKREHAAIGAAITVALGIASRRLHLGFLLWDKSLGDALYTVLVYFVVAFARPTMPPRTIGLTALAISVLVEVFQLTGIPARLPRVLQLVLGTTFGWHDIACYILGAAAVTGAHLLVLRRRDG